jgi:oligopeptide/dipeptide ABC transporter ATP-binding protein
LGREPLLEVRDLAVRYGAAGQIRAVEGVSFDVGAGETVGVLGESGCGKTTTAMALPGLLPPEARVVRGSIRFRGEELVGQPETRLRRLRGAELAVIFQEPALALNPVLTAGDQIAEVIRAHRSCRGREARERAARVLARFCSADTPRILRSYPHQLSGGQRQRVAIAQAVALEPALVIADEPTAALDPTVEAETLAVLKELRAAGRGLLLITHNPAILHGLADRVLVMYAGRIVERGATAELFVSPRHPYTRALLAAVPRAFAPHAGGPLPAIPGAPPDPARLPPGCAFEPRCSERIPACTAGQPPEGPVSCIRHAG